MDIVHFFSLSIKDKYTVFLTASSEGNKRFDLEYSTI